MKKEIVIGAASLVIIVLGIGLYVAYYHPGTPAPSTTLALPPGSYTEHAAYYDIAANYPTTTPLSSSADAAAVAQIQSAISGIISQFKTQGNFANLSPNDISMMGFDQGKKESLQIEYLIGSGPHTVSYIFTTYTDTLGAHPNTDFATFTFDTDPSTSSGQAGQALALSDIFASGSDYLGTLSTLARQALPAIIGQGSDPSFINPGTTPDASNFKNFFFDNSDFVILFPPYQVAPYSSGPQTLRIPVTQLDSILNPAYQQ
jgi:hypothetical protein